MNTLSVVLWFGVALCAVPAGVFCLQVLTACINRPSGRVESTYLDVSGAIPTAVILMPAHNEEKVIALTLASLQGLSSSFRVLVVADNCNDQTAALAKDAGAMVVERSSANLRGKGYALQHGLDHMKAHPPEVVIVLDADCTTSAADMHRLALACRQLARPVQGIYLMRAPQGSAIGLRVAEFAWLVKTMVRPLGWQTWGGTSQLMGSGFALPWAVAEQLNLASGHIVEDMKLTFDLAEQRQAPVLTTDSRVFSTFPAAGAAQNAQRRRWEHGHLSMVLTDVPKALMRSLESGNTQLLAVALDLLVPPLSLLVLALAALALLAVFQLVFWTPSIAALVALIMAFTMAVSVLLAWFRWGRHALSGTDLLGIPGFVLRKLGLYVGFIKRRETNWTRTDRD